MKRFIHLTQSVKNPNSQNFNFSSATFAKATLMLTALTGLSIGFFRREKSAVEAEINSAVSPSFHRKA